jgi:ATP-dependent Clp protease ATP-binding subunit ClpC
VFERFTERARQVIVLAQAEARALKHNYIGTEHLLLGLLREEEGLAARVLGSFGVTIEAVRADVARIIGSGDEVVGGQVPFTPRAKKILELSLREALDLGHNYIGTEHVLLGLLREGGGVAVRILVDAGATPEAIRDELLGRFSGARGETPAREPSNLEASRTALKWEYAVRTLEGVSETWPGQLSTWRGEGWELLTVVEEDGAHRALLERRASS